MKKSVTAVVILVVVIGGAMAWKYLAGGSRPGAAAAPQGLSFATPGQQSTPPMDGYKPATVDLGDGPVPLITVPLDTWGYAAIFAANGGINPSKNSEFYKRGHFAVQLARVEDAGDQLAGYAAGKYPIIWAQIDSLPQLAEEFKSDKRVMPKVLGLFDWSFGGDGIIAKNGIKSAADLKGKIVLTSSNTPWAFFLLWYLAQNNLTGNDVHVIWESDADKAVKLFQSHDSIAAWVTWSPFLADCLDPQSSSFVKNAHLMITSKDANQLIADDYIVRSDFAAENPKIAQAFVEAMAAGADLIQAQTFRDMASFYGLKSPTEAEGYVHGVHIANFPEALMFFDPKNPVGAEKVFRLSQEYSKELGVLPSDAAYEPADFMLPTIYAAIAKSGSFVRQKNEVLNSFNVATQISFADLENKDVVQTDNIQLVFDPNQAQFDITSSRPEFMKNMQMLDRVDEQAKFLATTAIELIGNADPSMKEEAKAKGPAAYAQESAEIQELSEARAAFVRQLLIDHYHVAPNRIISKGVGWDNPIDPTDFAKDRRVDVKFVSMQ